MDDPLSSLDWTLVRAFLAVAETGSLSAAARRLGSSQPTVGRQVRQLEDALGTPLFTREGRGMALTEDGEALLGPATVMGRAAADLVLAASGRDTGARGPVRITASVFVAHHVLPPILADLRRAHPGISLDITAADTSQNLLFSEADIAVRMYRPEQLDMVTRHVGDLEIGLYGATSYLDRAGRPETGEELLGHDIVGLDRGEELIRGFRAAGQEVSREDFPVRCDMHTVNWELVRAGCGLGFTQAHIGEATPGVERLRLPDLEIPRLPVWLTSHGARRRVPRVATVWAALVDGLGRLVA